MESIRHTTQLTQFSLALYQNFDKRADPVMKLLEAMCSQAEAKPVVATGRLLSPPSCSAPALALFVIWARLHNRPHLI